MSKNEPAFAAELEDLSQFFVVSAWRSLAVDGECFFRGVAVFCLASACQSWFHLSQVAISCLQSHAVSMRRKRWRGRSDPLVSARHLGSLVLRPNLLTSTGAPLWSARCQQQGPRQSPLRTYVQVCLRHSSTSEPSLARNPVEIRSRG